MPEQAGEVNAGKLHQLALAGANILQDFFRLQSLPVSFKIALPLDVQHCVLPS